MQRSFSDYYKIDKARLDELGVFDPILNYDTKVFVEPLLLKDSKSSIIKDSYQNYKKYFGDILKLLQLSDYKGDKCWKTAKNMVDFPEYKYTCIGYSSGTTDGAGSGTIFNDKILQSAIEIVDKAKGDPEIFLILPLLEEGIAGDRISDMVQNIIDEDICKYTEDIMSELKLKGNRTYKTKKYNRYRLLRNPFSKAPIKLIPNDILLNLPVADDIGSVLDEMTQMNSELRDIVNSNIGQIWYEESKVERKKILLNELKTNKDFFVETLKSLKDYKLEHYDLRKDYEGLYKWLENSQDFVKVELKKETTECSDNINNINSAVTDIIHHFTNTIEKKEIWRTFWTKHASTYRHVRVYYSQMLFFTVCNAWLASQDSNIQIKLHFSTRNIDIEFSISGKYKVFVHIKHANNTALKKSYEKILEMYRHKNDEKHVLLVMNFEDEPSNQLNEISIIENPICKIFEVDVSRKDNNEENENVLELFNEKEILDSDWGFAEFEGLDYHDNSYIEEKRRGGELLRTCIIESYPNL